MIVGFDDAKGAWLVRNSWGTGWGTHGYGWFGYGQGEHGLEHFTELRCRWHAHGIPIHGRSGRQHNGNLYESATGRTTGFRGLGARPRRRGSSLYARRKDPRLVANGDAARGLASAGVHDEGI